MLYDSQNSDGTQSSAHSATVPISTHSTRDKVQEWIRKAPAPAPRTKTKTSAQDRKTLSKLKALLSTPEKGKNPNRKPSQKSKRKPSRVHFRGISHE